MCKQLTNYIQFVSFLIIKMLPLFGWEYLTLSVYSVLFILFNVVKIIKMMENEKILVTSYMTYIYCTPTNKF